MEDHRDTLRSLKSVRDRHGDRQSSIFDRRSSISDSQNLVKSSTEDRLKIERRWVQVEKIMSKIYFAAYLLDQIGDWRLIRCGIRYGFWPIGKHLWESALNYRWVILWSRASSPGFTKFSWTYAYFPHGIIVFSLLLPAFLDTGWRVAEILFHSCYGSDQNLRSLPSSSLGRFLDPVTVTAKLGISPT
jgi:hypothetical protein